MLKTRAGNHGLMLGQINSMELQLTERSDRIVDRDVALEEQGKVILLRLTWVEVPTEEMEALR